MPKGNKSKKRSLAESGDAPTQPTPPKRRKASVDFSPFSPSPSLRRSRSIRLSSSGAGVINPSQLDDSEIPPDSFFRDPDWRPRHEQFRHGKLQFVIPEYGCVCGKSKPSTSGLGDLVCDGCYRVFHQQCLSIPLDPPPLAGDISYEFLCKSCNVRGQGVEYFLPVSKSWLDIAEVALYNLHIQNQDHPLHHPGIKPSRNRRFFNFQTEIIDFVLPRWSILCHGVDRGRNWESNLKNALESAPNFFQKYSPDMKDHPPLPADQEWWGLVTTTSPVFLDRRRLSEGQGVAGVTISERRALVDELLQTVAKHEMKVKSPSALSPTGFPTGKRKGKKSALNGSGGAAPSIYTKNSSSGAILKKSHKKKGPIPSPTPSGGKPKTENGRKSEWAEGVGDDEHYYVETIVSKRINPDSSVDYKIKWVGYDRRFNSWVPAADVQAPELIQKFEMSLLKSPATPPSFDEDDAADADYGKPAASPKKSGRTPTLGRSQEFVSISQSSRSTPRLSVSKELFGGNSVSASASTSPRPSLTSSAAVGFPLSTVDEFKKGKKVSRILGLNRRGDETLLACIQWKNSSVTWVPIRVLSTEAPALLIKYFESKLVFSDTEGASIREE